MYFAVSLLIERQMFLHAEKTLLNADFNTDAACKFGLCERVSSRDCTIWMKACAANAADLDRNAPQKIRGTICSVTRDPMGFKTRYGLSDLCG
jgi:hypothetical protein